MSSAITTPRHTTQCGATIRTILALPVWLVYRLGLRSTVPCGVGLAFMTFSWVPLHARDVVAAEGFTDFADRPRRLRLLLSSYSDSGSTDALLDAVQARIAAHAAGLRERAEAGDPLFRRLVDDGVIDGLDRALGELAHGRSDLTRQA